MYTIISRILLSAHTIFRACASALLIKSVVNFKDQAANDRNHCQAKIPDMDGRQLGQERSNESKDGCWEVGVITDQRPDWFQTSVDPHGVMKSFGA